MANKQLIRETEKFLDSLYHKRKNIRTGQQLIDFIKGGKEQWQANQSATTEFMPFCGNNYANNPDTFSKN